jgi:cytochrome P450
MAVDQAYTSLENASDAPIRCPIDHRALSQQKTAQVIEPLAKPVEQDADGVWHVRSYAIARAVLRSQDTKQAGFRAELIERLPQQMNPPILYQEGKPHHEQRKQTARFFTPKAVSENYRQLMEALAEHIIRYIQRQKQVDLSALSMKLAVRVAGEVVGLTSSKVPWMDRRLNAFFTNSDTSMPPSRFSPRMLLYFLQRQAQIAAFFYLDVKPAIEARRQQPREDVISHLLAQGASDTEILTECLTYGAAGMATTREFISIAVWHLMEQPTLRDLYLAGDDEERLQLLQELLRLEPVVGHLYRRTTAELTIEHNNDLLTIPQGSLIDLHIYAVNADQQVVGENPMLICPERKLQAERVTQAVMSFGDGHHRCPGAYIALQETDIFLQRLLTVEGLQIVKKPSITWNELTKGYEVRDFLIGVR